MTDQKNGADLDDMLAEENERLERVEELRVDLLDELNTFLFSRAAGGHAASNEKLTADDLATLLRALRDALAEGAI